MWLVVEDNGIGMSEHVLTGPLLDFGTSFWRSPLATEEFPGLMAAGMRAIGRFGIGFFSVFMLGSVVRVYSRRCDKGRETGRLLELRDGTGAKPILSPAPDSPVAIDGGTRVEVLLEDDPYEAGGLLHEGGGVLHFNLFSKGPMQLDALVGAVAPNLDVEIAVRVQGGERLIARPGDWLEISDVDFLRRLNPTTVHAERDTQKADRALMKRVEGANGQVFGRAFISPHEFLSVGGSCGWVTISGLRAARLRNVEGVLLGEAVTAARDAARPLATKEAIAAWASKQAELIVASVKDEERQARSAEVVLECGGDIGDLKVVKWGSNWLTAGEFEEKLRYAREVVISFDGEIDYDENEDDVHPRDFRERFTVAEGIAVVLNHGGGILNIGNSGWPRSITGRPKHSESNVSAYARAMIQGAWGENIEENEEDRVVGTVDGSDVIRLVTVFRVVDEGWPS